MRPSKTSYSDAHRDPEAAHHHSHHHAVESTSDISASFLSDDVDGKEWENMELDNGGRRSLLFARARAVFLRWRWLLDTALLLVVVGLLAERRVATTQSSGRDKGFETVGDLTGFAPEFTHQITTFHPTTDFVPKDPKEVLTNASIHEAWVAMVPRGLGYVEMKNPAGHDNLPVPLPEFAPRTVFTTSMTHQLHCLYAILKGYAGVATALAAVTAANGTSTSAAAAAAAAATAEEIVQQSSDGHWHEQHCFEYLRQAIMCSGDVALEGTQTTFPPGWTGSDGWDAKHVCRDYRQVFDYLEKNRADDDRWI